MNVNTFHVFENVGNCMPNIVALKIIFHFVFVNIPLNAVIAHLV